MVSLCAEVSPLYAEVLPIYAEVSPLYAEVLPIYAGKRPVLLIKNILGNTGKSTYSLVLPSRIEEKVYLGPKRKILKSKENY